MVAPAPGRSGTQGVAASISQAQGTDAQAVVRQAASGAARFHARPDPADGPRRDGTTDATIDPEHFHAQFAADVPATEAARMAVTQRPITLEALAGATGPDPLWKRVPSWFLLAGEDRNVPPDAIRFMAERAGARRLVEIAGASHTIAVSQPGPTAELILEAAQPPAVA